MWRKVLDSGDGSSLDLIQVEERLMYFQQERKIMFGGRSLTKSFFGEGVGGARRPTFRLASESESIIATSLVCLMTGMTIYHLKLYIELIHVRLGYLMAVFQNHARSNETLGTLPY